MPSCGGAVFAATICCCWGGNGLVKTAGCGGAPCRRAKYLWTSSILVMSKMVSTTNLAGKLHLPLIFVAPSISVLGLGNPLLSISILIFLIIISAPRLLRILRLRGLHRINLGGLSRDKSSFGIWHSRSGIGCKGHFTKLPTQLANGSRRNGTYHAIHLHRVLGWVWKDPLTASEHAE
jgi:hypothetical protein